MEKRRLTPAEEGERAAMKDSEEKIILTKDGIADLDGEDLDRDSMLDWMEEAIEEKRNAQEKIDFIRNYFNMI